MRLEHTDTKLIDQRRLANEIEQEYCVRCSYALTSECEHCTIRSVLYRIDDAPAVDIGELLRSQPYVKVEPYQWIPVRWRELTEEEKEHEYGEVPVAMADFLTPDDGDEILITRGGRVDTTVYCESDGYVGDEDWNDWLTEVDAWMPMPKPYRKDGAE